MEVRNFRKLWNEVPNDCMASSQESTQELL